MFSRLQEGEYATNYPPRRHNHSQPKSFADLASDRSFMLAENVPVAPRTAVGGAGSASANTPNQSITHKGGSLGRVTSGNGVLDGSAAGRPSGSRLIGPCSSFFERKWNIASDNTPSSSHTETSDRYKDPGVIYRRQPAPSKTQSSVLHESYPNQYTTSKQADFDPVARSNPGQYQARSLRPGRSEMALGDLPPEFRTTSQTFQSQAVGAGAGARARAKAGASSSQLPSHNIITGGKPLSNTSHDAFDPRRRYGKFEALEREKGATASDCFKEFT